MTKLPVMLDGNYRHIVGSIQLSDELLASYVREPHLVINPTIKYSPGLPPEVIAFSIYPSQPEPEGVYKKRRK